MKNLENNLLGNNCNFNSISANKQKIMVYYFEITFPNTSLSILSNKF